MASDRSDLYKLLKDLEKSNTATADQLRLLKKLKKEFEDTDKEARKSRDTFQEVQSGFNSIGENFGVRLGDAFERIEVEVKQVSRDIASMFDDLSAAAPDIAEEIAEEFNSGFRNALPDSKDIQAQINLNDLISQFKSKFPQMGDEMRKAFKTGDIANFYKAFGEEGMKNLRDFMSDKEGFGGLQSWLKKGGEGEQSAINFRRRLEEFEPAAQKTTKVMVNWGSILENIGNNILNWLNIRGMIDMALKLDQTYTDLKRELNIPSKGFAAAESAMSSLIDKGFQFGLTIEDSYKLITTLGEAARSTNVNYLAQTSQLLASVPQATGIALEQVSQIAGQMMFFGASAEKAKGAFFSIQKSAMRFGLSSSKVAKQFSEVFPKFARMGFKGGEESLAKMVARAEKLGISLEKSLDQSDQFLDIDSAIQASADLALLGGAASQISFTEIMQAAEQGGDAMMDLTARMTKDIGKLGDDGMLKLTANERRRIQAIATATKSDLTDLSNQIQSNLQNAAKMAAIRPDVFGELTDEEKDFLMSKMVMQGGKYKFDGLEGLKDVSKLNAAQIKAQFGSSINEMKNTEARALKTQSIQEELNALLNKLQKTVADDLLPVLRKFARVLDMVDSALDSFEKWVTDVFGKTAGQYAKTFAILGTVLLLTFPRTFIGLIGSLISGVVGAFKSGFKIFQGVGSLFGGGKGKGKVMDTVTSTSERMSGGGGSGGGYGGSSDGPARLNSQKNIFSRILDGIRNILKSAFDIIRTVIQSIGQILNDAIKAITKAGTQLIKGVSQMLSSIVDLVRNVGGKIIDTLNSLIQKIANLISNGGTQIVNAVSSLLGSIIKLVTTQGTALINGLSKILGSAIKLVQTQGVALANALGRVGSSVATNFFNIMKSIFDGLEKTSRSLPGLMSNLGKAVGAFFQGMSAGLSAFAMAMAAPTPLFGLPVGLIVLAMAMGIALALRIAGPGIEALGNAFTGLGKGLGAAAPAIQAAAGAISNVFSGIAKILETVGKVIISIIKEITNSIIQMSNIPGEKLGKVAFGIGAVATSLAAFGGGSLLGGIARGLGDLFGGDPIKKLMAFSQLNGTNLINVGNGIKLLASSLSSLSSVKIGNFVAEISKLGNLNSGPFKNIKDLSTVGANVKKTAESIVSIAISLQNIPSVDLSNINKLASVINIIATNIKSGITKLSTGAINSSIAKITANALLDLTRSLSQIKDLKTSPFDLLSKVLNNFIPSIKTGIGILSGGVASYQIAKFSASGLAEVGKSLGTVPNIKIEPFINIAKVMNETMSQIKTGLSKMSGMVLQSQLASVSASGIAKLANSLNTVPNVKVQPFINLSNVMSQTMGQIKEGLKKLSSLAIDAQVGRLAASGIESVARSLSNVPSVNQKPFDSLAKILSNNIPQIKKGMDLLGIGAAISSNIAKVFAQGLADTSRILNLVSNVKTLPFDSLSKIFNSYFPEIKKGISLMGIGMAINSKIASSTANSLVAITKVLNTVPSLKSANFEALSKILSNYIPGIKNGIGQMGVGAAISSKIAISTANSLVEVAKALNSVMLVKTIPFETLSKILSQYIPAIRNGISIMGAGAVVQSNLAISTSNALASVSRSLGSVQTVKTEPFESLSKVLSLYMPSIRNGVSIMGAGAVVQSNIAVSTSSALAKISNLLNAVVSVKTVPFEALSKILTQYIPGIRNGISLLGGSAVIQANLAILTANALASVSKSLSSVQPIKTAPFENLSKILSQFIPAIRNGIAMLGGSAVIQANLAIITSNALASVSKALGSVQPIKATPFESLAKILSQYIPSIKNGIGLMGAGAAIQSNVAVLTANALASVSRSLGALQPVKSAPFEALSKILSQYIPNIKTGIGLMGMGAALQSNIAISTANALAKVSRLLNTVVAVKTLPFESLSKILSQYIPSIKNGISLMGAGAAVQSNIAIITANALASVSKSLSAVQTIKSAPFEILSRVLTQYVPSIRNGISMLGGGAAIQANIAILTANALASVSKSLSSVQAIKTAPFEILAKVLTQYIPNIKNGISLMGAGTAIQTGIAVMTANALSNVTKSLSTLQTIKTAPFETLSKILSQYIPNIKNGINLLGGTAVIQTTIAIATASALARVSTSLSGVQMVKSAPFETLSKILSQFIPSIKNGISLMGAGTAVQTGLAVATSTALAQVSRSLSNVQTIKSAPFEVLSKILSQYIPSIKNGISLMGMGAAVQTSIAIATSSALAQVSKSLSAVQTVKIAPFEILSKILSQFIPSIKNGIGLLGGAAVIQTNIAVATANALSRVSSALGSVQIIKTIPFESLSKILSQYIPNIRNGIALLGGGTAIQSSVAIITANALSRVSSLLNTVVSVKSAPFESLAKILSQYIPNIKNGLSLLGAGAALSSGVGIITAKGIASISRALTLVQTVQSTPFEALSKILLSYIPSIKNGISLMSGSATIQSNIAIVTANGLASVSKSLSKVMTVSTAPFDALSKILSQYIPSINKGIGMLSGTVVISSKIAIETSSSILTIANYLSKLQTVKTTPFDVLSRILSQYIPAIKKGISLMGTGALIQSKLAIVTSEGLVSVSRALSSVQTIKSAPFESMSKILSQYIPSIKAGMSLLSGGTVITTSVARITASALSAVSASLNTVQTIKIAPFEALSKILNTYFPNIKNGIGLLGAGMALSANVARVTANGLSAVAKSLNTVQTINSAPFEALSKILNQFMPSIRKGMSLLSGGIVVSANVARLTASGISAVASSLNTVQSVKTTPFESLSKILIDYMPNIKKGISSLSGGAVISSNVARVTVGGIAAISKTLNTVQAVNIAPFDALSKVLSQYLPLIRKGLGSIGGGAAISANIGKITASAIAEISIALNKVQNVKTEPFDSLSKVLSQYIPSIRKNISLMGGGAAISANIAKLTASALAMVSISLGKVQNIKTEPFEVLSKILTVYFPNIRKGISLLGTGAAISTNVARITANALMAVSLALSKVQTLKTTTFESLSKILTQFIPGIKKGIEMMGGGAALSSNVARITANGLAQVSKSLASVQMVKSGPFEALAAILNQYIPNIRKGLSLLGGGMAISANIAKISSSAIGIVSKYLNTVETVKTLPFDMLSRVLTQYIPAIKKGLGLLSGGAVISSNIARITSSAIASVSQSLNTVQTIKTSPFEILTKILSLYIPQIKKGLSLLGDSGVISAGLATVTTSALVSVSKSLNKVELVKTAPFEVMSKILSDFIPSINKGVGMLSGGAAISSNVAKITASAIAGISKILNNVVDVKTTPFESLSKILNNYIPSIKEGLSILSGSTLISANIAKMTASAIAVISTNLNMVSLVKTSPFENLANIFNTYIPSIKKGINMLDAGTAINSGIAILAANNLSSISRNLSLVTDVKTSAFDNLSKILNQYIGSISEGIGKLSSITLQSQTARIASNGLLNVARSLMLVPMVSITPFSNLSQIFSNFMSNIKTGMSKMSDMMTQSQVARISANGLINVANTLKNVPLLNVAVFDNLSKILGGTMQNIKSGMGKLSDGVLSFQVAKPSANALSSVAKVLSTVPNIPLANFTNLANVLNPQLLGLIMNGLIKLAGASLFSSAAVKAANEISKLSKLLLGISNVPAGPITELSNMLNNVGMNLVKGIGKLSLVSPLIIPALIAASGVSKIFSMLGKITSVNLQGITAFLPTLGSIPDSIIKFSKIGAYTPSLISAGIGISSLSKSMQSANRGFVVMATIPWNVLSAANPILDELMSNLIKFGMKGLLAAPGIIALATSMTILGKSLKGAASSFGISAKSMAAYNNESEKLKIVATAPKKTAKSEELSAADRLKKSVVTGAENQATMSTAARETGKIAKEVTKPQVVQIKPIQIDLKLNGRMLQQVIVEANYNRT